MPQNRVYIVNSPRFAAVVDRHSKTVSFAPFVVQFAKRILIPSKEGLEALSEIVEENGVCGCRAETLKIMHTTLAPGKSLDCTTQDMLNSVSRLLHCIDITKDFDLFAWIKKLVTQASTDAIYRTSKNPFQDPAVEAGFW